MGTEADYLIDQHFDRKHGEYGDPLPPVRVNPLVRCQGTDSDCPDWCDRQHPHKPNNNCNHACSVHPKTSNCNAPNKGVTGVTTNGRNVP